MTDTQENAMAWEVIDGKPVAHIHVDADMTIEELRGLRFQTWDILEQMEWHVTDWVGAGMQGKQHGRLHILHKSDYFKDKSCKALCGQAHTWDIAFRLDRDPRKEQTCKACYEIVKGVHNAWPAAPAAEQESEGNENGGK